MSKATNAYCRNCDGGGWVCENHPDRPWAGAHSRVEACDCGAGMPCGVCNLRMASARYSEPWRELVERLDSLRSEMELRFTGEFAENAVNTLDRAATTIRTLQARLDAVREEEREACAKVAGSIPYEFLPLRDPSQPMGADEDLKNEGFRDAQRIIATAIRARGEG